MNSSRLQLEAYRKGILEGNRTILARAITLLESTLPEDQRLADALLDSVTARAGQSLRIGITGAPGVGKSTFIEAFGKVLADGGTQVAVLTIDPTSQLTGGSILGDKTRMPTLAHNPRVFIRPTPSGSALGGVATSTRETVLLCEAAGFHTIIIETVGTGQSEITLKSMVDFFLLLVQPGGGDELQGIKKGIVEMADAIVVTKADGENTKAAQRTLADYQHALHLLHLQESGWKPRVLACSALAKTGLREIVDLIEEFKRHASASGSFQQTRREQQVQWLRDHFHYLLSLDPGRFPEVGRVEQHLAGLVQAELLSPRKAAQSLLDRYHDAVSQQRRDNTGKR